LMLFALAMVWESGHRLVAPVAIAFDQAIVVAIIGLVVNGISAVILKPESHHHDSHHGHAHGHTHRHTQDRAHDHAHDHAHDDDHNLKAAYLHVIADALTSILAIAALISGKYLGWSWMDPVMGLVGAAVIIRWSWGLVGQTSGVLLDHQAPDQIIEAVRAAIENGSTDKVTDLHVWSIAPGKWAGAVAVISDDPQAPAHYKSLVASRVQVDHLTVEVHPCPDALSRNAAPGS
ncbi:MAG: CDF family Co(II)/Ni(II) efflux transporter DmeF, partial [Rhodobacteraceae bacterium]|nr:CDF family Co(II)/Ni(II) efflux transporter DmeF [Paracoccaceae bacterium]